MLLLIFLAVPISAFFEVKGLYEVYQYYQDHSSYLEKSFPYIQPVARPALISSTTISKGDMILKVPSVQVLTSFDEYEWSSYFKDESIQMQTVALLAYYKLTMNKSEYKELVDALESDLDTPSIWNDQEIEILKGYTAYPERAMGKDSNFERYKQITNTIPDVRALAHEESTYYWGINAIKSFSINISKHQWKLLRGKSPENDDKLTFGYAFFPFFDLINKHRAPDISHPDPYPLKISEAGIQMFADRNYGAYEEVYIPYGHKDNYELLNSSGEILFYNSKDVIEVDERQNPKCKSKQCLFYLGNKRVSTDYLAFLETEKDKELEYRRGVKRTMDGFLHDLRSHRRRVNVLVDYNFRQAFYLGIAERWNAYKALALIDRKIIGKMLNQLKLTN